MLFVRIRLLGDRSGLMYMLKSSPFPSFLVR